MVNCDCSKPLNKQCNELCLGSLPVQIGSNASTYTSTGSISIKKTGNSFVDLAYSVPFLSSDADIYITSLASKRLISEFEPTFFQVPYIYSYANNLINGNYTSSSSDDGNLIITTYQIPYKGELKNQVATIVTYYDKSTNILFHEIPREFSYNSVDQASVSYVQIADGSFIGKLNIPSSFITNVPNLDNKNLFFDFNIKPSNDITFNTSQISVAVSPDSTVRQQYLLTKAKQPFTLCRKSLLKCNKPPSKDVSCIKIGTSEAIPVGAVIVNGQPVYDACGYQLYYPNASTY